MQGPTRPRPAYSPVFSSGPAVRAAHGRSRPRRFAALLLLAAALLACRIAPDVPRRPPPYEGERPEFLSPDDVAGVVVLSGIGPGLGSAVVLDDEHILTALHVWQALAAASPVESGPFAGGARVRVDGRETLASPIALGDLQAPHGDWAIVRVERPSWRPSQAMALHVDALDAAWLPPPGEPLFVVGYASTMFPEEGVDPARSAPVVVTAVSSLPSTRRAELTRAWLADDRGMDLPGMSGGAACFWNAAEGRLELVGTFTGQFEVVRRVKGPFGLGFESGRRRYMLFHRLPAEEVTAVRR